MAKQINIGLVLNDSEVATPPSGYVATFKKDVGGGQVQEFVKDSLGNVSGVVAGVSTVNGGGGVVTLKSFDFTQWRRDVGSVVVADGSSYNIFDY